MRVKRIVAMFLAVVLAVGTSLTGALAANETYTVKKGDSLWKIASQTLGSGFRWKEIYDANTETIKDPGQIYVGQVLNIPGNEPAPEAPSSGQTEDFTQLFLDAQQATLYMSAYDMNAYFPFWFSWFNLVQFHTYDEIMEAASNPSEEMRPLFESLEATFANIRQVRDYEDIVIDIWAGHDTIPVPGGVEDDCTSSTNAALCDDEGFRPFMTFYPAADVSSVVGTILAVPSIRGGLAELVDVASVFNAAGYNVFTLQPRMNTVAELGYIDLQLDAQRAIRYIKYYAESYGLDPNRLIVIGGSKGNLAHEMAYEYFDMTPVQVAEALGKPLSGYECDEIDRVPSNIQVSIVNYGNRLLCKDGEDFAETIYNSRIYSEEALANGYKFPALYVIIGNQDETQMVKDLPAFIAGMYNYNLNRDKLYPIGYEVHIMDQVQHGHGMALESANVASIWKEADQFIKMNLP